MIKELIVPAPAKINLHLDVGSLGQDGYHQIASLFQAVSLYDLVRVELRDTKGITLDCECNCEPVQNTAYSAASAFTAVAARSGCNPVPGLHIRIEKRIPAGAGLGGGSSDAASTLKALSVLLPGYVSTAELMRLAASVGSDVPFFLGSACAAVTSRGEQLQKVPPREDFCIVIVDPGFSIATKEAYGTLDASRKESGSDSIMTGIELEASLGRVVDAYSSQDPVAWSFRNDFYAPLSRKYPKLATCRQSIVDTGARFVLMSGSGSALYGIYASNTEAQHALRELSALYTARLAFPLARLPLSI